MNLYMQLKYVKIKNKKFNVLCGKLLETVVNVVNFQKTSILYIW